MTHKEMTTHIRNRIKAAGIRASVSKYDSCGVQWVRVSTASYDQQFTADEQRQINLIASVNGLTKAGRLAIDVESTFGQEAHFCYA